MKGKSTVLILLSLLFVGLIAGCVETAPEQPFSPTETVQKKDLVNFVLGD